MFKLNMVALIAALLFLSKAAWGFQHHLISERSIKEHPRLLLPEQEKKALKARISSDPLLKKIHDAILMESDAMLTTEPVKHIKIGRRLLDKSRECLKRVFYLSYAWRMTADKRYLNRAEKELLAVSSFPDWNPSHFLDVAEMTLAVSIGYDWLYSNISHNAKEKIKNAILYNGLEPSLLEANNSFLTAKNNWNQVCNTGMLYGALAVYEDTPELAEKIIKRSISSIHLPMEEYGPDGAYPEGYNYWGYGTSFNVLFISALEQLFNDDFKLTQSPGFLKTAEYYLHMVGPSGLSFNYSDAYSSKRSVQPTMFWFASKTANKSLLYQESEKIRNSSAEKLAQSGDRLLPALLIWNQFSDLQNITPPTEKMWIGHGKTPVALIRTSWTNPNALFVGIKGGSAATNHAHMDIGSFVMEANGVRWAMDAGMQDYESLESKGLKIFGKNSQRWEVFRLTNYIHNTLTVNGNLQNVKGFAPLIAAKNHLDLPRVTVDLKEIYPDLKKSIREIAVVDKKFVTVTDQLQTGNKESLVRWQLLTPANVKIDKDKAVLEKNGKKLVLTVKGLPVKWKIWSTQPPRSYDASNKGTRLVGFEINIPANTQKEFTVYLLPQNKSKSK